jgi:hypothetical protein
MERAGNIALLSRRLLLLSHAPSLLYGSPKARMREALTATRAGEKVLTMDQRHHPLNMLLAAGADDTDRVCAAAVQKVRERGTTTARAALDLVNLLPADHLLAIYYALPEDKRELCERDPVWAHHLREAPDGIEDLMEMFAELVAEDCEERLPLETLEARDYQAFSEGVLREFMGWPPWDATPHGLSEEEQALAQIGEDLAAECLRSQ